MKVIIGEDEVIIAEDLMEVVEKLGHEVLAVEYNEKNILDAIQKLHPELVLLDIRMDRRDSGFEIAKAIKTKGVPFIFITSHHDDDTITKAHSLDPIGYIVKPFTFQQIKATLSLAENQISKKSDDTKTLKSSSQVIKVAKDEVVYIKADNVYCEIYTVSKRHLVRSSLTALIEELDWDCLVRINRKFVINRQFVTEETRKEIVLGEYITIQKPARFGFLEQL